MNTAIVTIPIYDGCFTSSLVPPSNDPRASDWCAVLAKDATGKDVRSFLRRPGRSGNLDARQVLTGQILEFSRDVKEGGKVVIWNRRYGKVLKVSQDGIDLEDLGRDLQGALNPSGVPTQAALPAQPQNPWFIPNPTESRAELVESPLREVLRGAEAEEKMEASVPSAPVVPNPTDVAVEPPAKQERIPRAVSRNELVEIIKDYTSRPFQSGRAVRDYRGEERTGSSMMELVEKTELSDSLLYELEKLAEAHPELAALPEHQLPDRSQLNILLKAPARERVHLWNTELRKTRSLVAKDIAPSSLAGAVNRRNPSLQLKGLQKAFGDFMDTLALLGINPQECAPFEAAKTALEGQLQAKSQ